MASVHDVTRRVRSITKRTASNAWLEFLQRAGYVVRGVLYAAMGMFALGLALGKGGIATDQSGSLAIISQFPGGKLLLIVVVIGLGAYAVWGLVRAIYDPLHRGHDAVGIAERLGFVWSAIAYSAITLFALNLLAGSGASATRDSTQQAIARVLQLPAGHLVAIAIGIVSIGVGLGQFFDAYRAVFKQDLKRTKMNKAEKEIVDLLGRLGMISRGVIFTIVGWFVLQGGLHNDPSKVHGYGGAFLTLLNQPFGRVMLGAVAVGFIALGLHSFACARWIRLLSSER
jgi:hypothetical protein